MDEKWHVTVSKGRKGILFQSRTKTEVREDMDELAELPDPHGPSAPNERPPMTCPFAAISAAIESGATLNLPQRNSAGARTSPLAAGAAAGAQRRQFTGSTLGTIGQVRDHAPRAGLASPPGRCALLSRPHLPCG